ncbi:MAG: hypothetical protein JJU29_05175 [Verrucomicrobia bacterium]|nr:hypothetical protein [Verrucomicrobiota bacterium]MCH8514046.1 phage protease [Kiritimatiellia bacterium]
MILNRESFSLPEDGWYHVAPLGVFPHAASGVVQVVDAEACGAMAAAFGVEAAARNFAGLLIDFDHFSLDAGNKSEAAGWITALEARVEGYGLKVAGSGGEEVAGSRLRGNGSQDLGLWAEIRWSDTGEAAVRGGRYRFLSPVWSRSDCVDLGDGRVRPVRLLNAAVTNDPNLKGLVPLSNRGQRAEGRGQGEMRTSNIEHRTSNVVEEVFANAEEEKRLKWALGNSPEDRHCPSCTALAGMVQTEAAWEAAELRPKSGRLFCGEHCHCRLVETDDPVQGDLEAVQALYEGNALGNAARLAAVRAMASLHVQEAKWALRNNWTEEAREASLAVRRAKAKKRDGDEDGDEDKAKKRSKELKRIREKLRRGEKLTDEERERLQRGYGIRDTRRSAAG